MLQDEYLLNARGGKGGPGFASFARRKYEAFGGPDGGDGGRGGNSVLVGKRSLDNLNYARRTEFAAAAGGPGASNLKIGAMGEDLHVYAPLGTLAYDAQTGEELGSVKSSGSQLILAHGGKGGRGNSKFASGGRRAPKEAEDGKEAVDRQVLLRYRIYADMFLVEDCDPYGDILLPDLLNRQAEDIDTDLYWRKPRWIRFERNYRNYDVAYLPLRATEHESDESSFLPHLFWATSVFINAMSYGESASETLSWLLNAMAELPLRRLQKITIFGDSPSDLVPNITSDAGPCEVEIVDAGNDINVIFDGQLTGGTID